MNWRRRLACLFGIALAVASCDQGVDFDARVEKPAFAAGKGPEILFDEGHHNHHGLGSTYRPFAELLGNDGFQMASLSGPVTSQSLSGARILAIVSARAESDTNAEPAFTAQEIGLITNFVRRGGSLLLVTDHYPFPNAVETLANALGLDVAKGMTFDPIHHRRETKDDSRLVFSRSNGLLGSHPIISGRNSTEAVDEIETFTGDAVRPRPDTKWMPLMKLSDTAINRLGVPEIKRDGDQVRVEVEFISPTPAAGWSQGMASEMGAGRIVVLAEAAMITAQEDGGRKIGMNSEGNDNRQFLLNVMRWLARAR